ncbi:hypothetical protein SAMN05421773_110107 [Streptomyces aidingensis]|uniref:Uncharacterized protein n=1 Tax=Streptomyces aidingensis TaxID=910347 RepID=A0A1I1PWT5_9ACTN|nr:hypothetical protein SAMN05421773_110107 [Streptomyces aidingensis]
MHAVLSCAHDALIRDIEPVPVGAEVLHVCFPWSEDFAAQVKAYADEHGAGLVVVHSTVPPGTCDPHGWVHSPVRGRHPHLAPALRAFIKHFGGHHAAEAAQAWEDAGVRTRVHTLAADTEAGKLWELVQFGVQVRVEKAIHAWCAERGLDADVVYRQMAETYNDGYADLGEHRFLRPVLAHMPGDIGGHCVRPMAALLDHPLAEMVTRGLDS